MRKEIVESGRKTEKELRKMINSQEYNKHGAYLEEALQKPNLVCLVKCVEKEDYGAVLDYQDEMKEVAIQVRCNWMLHIPRETMLKEHYYIFMFKNKDVMEAFIEQIS